MRPLVMLMIGLLMACAIYARVLSYPFVYEDFNWLPYLADGLVWQVPSRTLAMWLYAQESTWGFSSVGMHAASMGLFALVGFSLYPFARLWVSPLSAACASIVMLWHPLNTQAASYISAQPDLLMTLAIVWACLVAARADGWRWPLVGVLMLVAMLAKESGVLVVPCVGLTLWSTGRWTRAASIACGIALAGGLIGATRLFGALPEPSAWIDHAGVQAIGLWRNLRLFMVPVGLSIDPDPWAIESGWRVVALAWTVSLAIVAVQMRRRLPVLSFGVLWCLLGVSLRFVAVSPGEPLHEHQMLLSMIGLSMMAGETLASLLPSKGSLAYA